MLLKIFFFFYTRYYSFKTKVKLLYYKFLWRDQLNFDDSLVFDRTSEIIMQSGTCKATFGVNVHFRKYCNIICSNQGALIIGDNVFFNNYCSINCLKKITIGNDSIFGEGVRLYDHNHLFNGKDLIRLQGYRYGEISIGSNCWIGSNTIILPDVSIGNNVVVGANNLINKPVPDNTIVKAKSEQIIEPYYHENK